MNTDILKLQNFPDAYECFYYKIISGAEITIFVGTKNMKFRCWAVFFDFFTKNELESDVRLGFRQTFFPGGQNTFLSWKKCCRLP